MKGGGALCKGCGENGQDIYGLPSEGGATAGGTTNTGNTNANKPTESYTVKQSDIGAKAMYGISHTKRTIQVPYDPNYPDWHVGRTLVQQGTGDEMGTDIGVSAMGGKGTLTPINKTGNSILEHMNSSDREDNSYWTIGYFVGGKRTTAIGKRNSFDVYEMTIYSAGMAMGLSPVDAGTSPGSEFTPWKLQGPPMTSEDSSDAAMQYINNDGDSTLFKQLNAQ